MHALSHFELRFAFHRTMCSDLVYVILFPQLLMVVHFRHYCNTYGSLAAYITAMLFRLGGGEELLHLKAFIHFPYFEEGDDEAGIWEKQRFPFRTFCMLMSLGTLAAVSKLTDWLFHSGILHPKYDYFRCVVNIPEDRLKVIGGGPRGNVRNLSFFILSP